MGSLNHTRARTLQLVDQGVDTCNEFVPVRVGAVVNQARGLISQCLLTCNASPAAHLTIGEQGQATEVTTAAREVHLAEEVLEAELEGFNVVRHVAMQQFTAG